MSAYFDASLIVSLFVEDALSERAEAYVLRDQPIAFVSDFAAAEFVSALNLRVRSRQLSMARATATLSEFDQWRMRNAASCDVATGDIATADAFLRRFDLPLRAPDALHLAIVRRLDIPLATFDAQLAASAGLLGLVLAET